MKKFSFTLERVLDYKEQVEQNLRNEHGQAVRQVKEQEEKIGELETGFRSFKEQVDEIKFSEISSARLQGYPGYLSLLIGKIASEKEELARRQREEERRRELVIEAKKETSSIQMLKDKKRREYDALEAKEHEREVEEFVSNRSIARKRERENG